MVAEDISMVLFGNRLFSAMTVRENILLGAYLQRQQNTASSRMGGKPVPHPCRTSRPGRGADEWWRTAGQ